MNFDVVGEAYGHSRQADLIESAQAGHDTQGLAGGGRGRDMVALGGGVSGSTTTASMLDRAHAIPPGVDLRRLRPEVGQREHGPVRILMVGGDFERKGGLDLLDAMRVLDRPAELDIVSSSAEVPAWSSDPGSFRRRRQLDARSPICTAAPTSSYCPFRGDCTPLAVAEALACGLPSSPRRSAPCPSWCSTATTDCRRARDPRQLAQALAVLIDEPATREAFGARSRRLAEAEHDVDKNCRKIFDLMAAIADGASARAAAGARSA